MHVTYPLYDKGMKMLEEWKYDKFEVNEFLKEAQYQM